MIPLAHHPVFSALSDNARRQISAGAIERRADGWYDITTNCPLTFDQVEYYGLDATLRS